jgi:hypothetical protein
MFQYLYSTFDIYFYVAVFFILQRKFSNLGERTTASATVDLENKMFLCWRSIGFVTLFTFSCFLTQKRFSLRTLSV